MNPRRARWLIWCFVLGLVGEYGYFRIYSGHPWSVSFLEYLRNNLQSEPLTLCFRVAAFGAALAVALLAISREAKKDAEKEQAEKDARHNSWQEEFNERRKSKPDYKLGIAKPLHSSGPHPVVAASGLLGSAPASLPVGFSWEGEPLHYKGELHGFTVGATGTGKNATAETPMLMDYEGSAFVIDPKGQLAAITGRHRFKSRGQRVCCINPFGSHGIPSVAYNPLKNLDPSSPAFVADCRQLAEGLVTIRNGDGSHWDDSARQLVELVILWTVLHGKAAGRPQSLATVLQIINFPKKMRIRFFEELLSCPTPEVSTAAGRWTEDSKEIDDCIGTARVHLGFLQDSAILRVLDGEASGLPEISFADLKRTKQTVYLILPPERLHSQGRLLRLLVMAALSELYRETTRPPAPVLLLLDEFAALGHLSMIENVASIGRDYRLKLWMVCQNLTQLKTVYGEGWESLFSAAGVKQFFRPEDSFTTNWLSSRLGVTTEIFTSTSTSAGHSTSNAPTSAPTSNTSISTNTNERPRPVMHPQEIYALAKEAQLIVASGVESGLMSKRVPYWDYKRPDWLLSPDPFHDPAGFAAMMKTQDWFN